MKKTVVNLLVIFGIVLATFFGTRAYYPKVEERVRVDTTYIDRPYEVTKIKEVEKPVRITEYRTDTVRVTSTKVVKDTVYINTDLNTFAYDARYLTNYPTAPKFLGLEHKDNQLDLTYLRTNGLTRTKTWNVGDRGYRVGLNEGQPNIETFEESKDKFSHYVESGYIRNFSYWSPYLQYSAEYLILGVDVKGTVNINHQPFVKAGIKYDL